MTIRLLNRSPHPMPRYQTEGSAGMDLRVWLDESITLGPLERALFPTGLYLELPKGYEAQIRPRSGLSIGHGITLINAVGTIDSDYRGEIKIALVNLSDQAYTIHDGDRVAQMIIARHETTTIEAVTSLEQTERGEGGFGSTGIKE